jgi:hypothetical protein
MFNVKFKNPHDIIGEKGLVKVHQKEVEKEKVIFLITNINFLRSHSGRRTNFT